MKTASVRSGTKAIGIAFALWLGAGLQAAESPGTGRQARTPDVVYVGTPYDVVSKMLKMARITVKDMVFDLGCGDGRVVVLAARKYGCRGRGFDIDPERVRAAQRNAARNGVEHLVQITEADLFTLDLDDADVLALYLLPDINRRLLPKLMKLKPGVRMIFHDYGLEGFEADQTVRITSNEDGAGHTLFLYTTPLKTTPADPATGKALEASPAGAFGFCDLALWHLGRHAEAARVFLPVPDGDLGSGQQGLRELESCGFRAGRPLDGAWMSPALQAPAGQPCLLCRSSSTMAGIAFVVASRIQVRRARRIRHCNYEHEP